MRFFVVNSPVPNPRIYLSSPHMGGQELELVKEAFATNWIAPLGPHVDKFESEFVESLAGVSEIGHKEAHNSEGRGQRADSGPPSAFGHPPSSKLHAAALTSGTAAIHLALRWLGVGPGDEVICSTFTFSATVNPVLYEKATPVFVDSDRRSWNMDPALLAEAIADGIKRGKKAKAVILVHLYGQSADLDPIVALCEQHGIPLIEDAAEALGAVYYSARTDDRGQRSDSGPPSAISHPPSGSSPPSALRDGAPRHRPRHSRAGRGLLLQRQQDHHDLRRRDAGLAG